MTGNPKHIHTVSHSAAAAAASDVPGRDVALRQYLAPIQAFLDDKTLTEICINRPGELFTEGSYGWAKHDVPAINLQWCKKLATLVATFSNEKINEQCPILSGMLPDGERAQIVIPPAVEIGTVSITIRKPSLQAMSPAQYEATGFHMEVPQYKLDIAAPGYAALHQVEKELLQLREARRFWEFYELAIRERKNIVISGATGSGKTTFGRALVNLIPKHERLLTIEDVREMFFERHENRVHLLYSELGKGAGEITGKTLLQACLRMKPDRVLLAELRSGVAYDYIVNISSGHPGSITTVHAGSAAGAYEMLSLRVKESEEGRTLAREDILGLLRAEVDIVIQVQQLMRPDDAGQLRKVRRVTEIHYDPANKRKSLA